VVALIGNICYSCTSGFVFMNYLTDVADSHCNVQGTQEAWIIQDGSQKEKRFKS